MKRVVAALAALCLIAPASAQEEVDAPTQLDHAVARAIAVVMGETAYESWTFQWGPLGVRGNREINWHLAGPDERADDRGVFKRNGWVHVEGSNVGVQVCGSAQDVRVLAFRDNRTTAERARRRLVAALQSAEIRVERIGDEEFELGAEGRFPARLRIHGDCTGPYSAAAQRCWATYTLILREDEATEATCVIGRGG